MKKAIRPIRATRISASTINTMMITTGLSLSPPQSPPPQSLLQLHAPPQQVVVGGRQSQLQLQQAQQSPLPGPGAGTKQK